MRNYELGGIRFVTFEGEVYVRYDDIHMKLLVANDTSSTHDITPKAEDTPPPTPKKRGRPRRVPRTYEEAGLETDYARAVGEKNAKIAGGSDLETEVKDLVEQGFSLDEILLAFPLESSRKLNEYYDKYREHADD